jgi:hypothetical protein
MELLEQAAYAIVTALAITALILFITNKADAYIW